MTTSNDVLDARPIGARSRRRGFADRIADPLFVAVTYGIIAIAIILIIVGCVILNLFGTSGK